MAKILQITLFCLVAWQGTAFGQSPLEFERVTEESPRAYRSAADVRDDLPAPSPAKQTPVETVVKPSSKSSSMPSITTPAKQMPVQTVAKEALPQPPIVHDDSAPTDSEVTQVRYEAPLATLGLPITELPSVKKSSPAAEQGQTGQTAIRPMLPAPSVQSPTVNCSEYVPSPRVGYASAAGSSYCVWGSAELGLWWVQGSRLPALVTTSPAGTLLADAGVIGTSGTSVLFGNDRANGDPRLGGRFAFGGWLNDDQTIGVEAGLILIGSQQLSYTASSDGTQILSRPFIDATTGKQVAELVSYPGVLAGSVGVTARQDPLYIADALLRANLYSDCWWRIDASLGYRYANFQEGLQIQENLTSLSAATLGTKILVTDSFATRNDFNGGLLALQTEWINDQFSLQMFGKLGLGDMYRQVAISGNTVITAPGATPIVGQGGLLALPSNIGTFTSNHFAWIPEAGFTAGWQITPRLRATVGYSMLWMTSVVRPGDQIDRTVNPNFLPPAIPSTPVRPIFVFRDTDVWVQGIRLGLEYRF